MSTRNPDANYLAEASLFIQHNSDKRLMKMLNWGIEIHYRKDIKDILLLHLKYSKHKKQKLIVTDEEVLMHALYGKSCRDILSSDLNELRVLADIMSSGSSLN